MMAYLDEVKRVTSTLHELGHLDQFFEQRLLLAMDEGWGEMEFMNAIRDTLLQYYNVSEENAQAHVLRVPKEKSNTYWESQLDFCKRIAKEKKDKGGFSIIVCDLLEHTDNLNSIIFLNMLAEFSKQLEGALFVAWIPYGNAVTRKRAEERLSQIMSIRSVDIPAIPLNNQVAYVAEKLAEKDFFLSDASEELLKKWICMKEEDGNHRGYLTLENMCGTLIYQTVLRGGDMKIEEQVIEEQMMYSQRQDAYELLNELIGMSVLKAKIKEIVAQIKLQRQLVDMGRKIERPSLHMAFLGNPGTGKTTLARILGKIFKQENILRKGEFYEHSGNEFLEGNVSDMVRNMRKTCKESYGSVMFIDEAYGMAIGHSNGNTGDDIVPILVEEMENYRDDMCVIFAGYEDEMNSFFKTNSGLKSRIPHILHFPNYSREELMEIFYRMTEGSFECEVELKETLEDYLESISDAQYESKEFSNARFIRNLYERTWGKAAYRINFTEDKEIILKESDLSAALEEDMFVNMVEKKEKRRIGFI